MLWASRNKHRGRHAAAAATEGGREYIQDEKPASQENMKFLLFFFLLLYHQNCEWQEGLRLFLCWTESLFPGRGQLPRTNRLPASSFHRLRCRSCGPWRDTRWKFLRDSFSFTPWNTVCVTPLRGCNTSDSCCPLRAWWEMVDCFIAHGMMDSPNQPQNVILVN